MSVGAWAEGKEINWYMWMQRLEKQYWIDCLVRNGTCTNTILSAVLQAGLGMRVRKWSGKEAISLVSPDPHWEHSCGESNLKDKLVLLVIPYHHCVCVCACGEGCGPSDLLPVFVTCSTNTWRTGNKARRTTATLV